MPRRVTKWACVFCGEEYMSEIAAQRCEMQCQEKMTVLTRTVNRQIRCSNPQCERHTKPYFRSDWRPKDLNDRPWHSYDGCPVCGSQFEECVQRESSVDTPEMDRAMQDTSVLNEVMTAKDEQGPYSSPAEVITEEQIQRLPAPSPMEESPSEAIPVDEELAQRISQMEIANENNMEIP